MGSGLSGWVVGHEALRLRLVRLPFLILHRLGLGGQHLQGRHRLLLHVDRLHVQGPLNRLEHPGLVRFGGILHGGRSSGRGRWWWCRGLSLSGRVLRHGRHRIHVRLMACRAGGVRRHLWRRCVRRTLVDRLPLSTTRTAAGDHAIVHHAIATAGAASELTPTGGRAATSTASSTLSTAEVTRASAGGAVGATRAG